MKVQLHEQTMRLRLDEAELAQLLAGETVENVTRFGGSGGWGTAVSLHGGESAVLLDSGTDCRLVLPRSSVEDLAGRLPCRDGLAFALYLDDGTTLQLQLDVDVRDSVRQRGVTRRSSASSV
ncbi:hypothetical protein JY456_04650 [Stenotrophomonas maltophilia]|nr:hypothetical protein [Stenotrophomonas maltophilia]